MTNEVRPRPVRPLEGIRVVDMSTVLVGPMCAQILADYGADVIKVESPDGDVMRDAGPMRNLRMGPMYLHANRNKRSLVLDVKKPAAREALLRICAESDCFITNTRPAAMERLQLDYPSIRAAREDIVYLSVVGYGQAGPYAHKPAVDDVIQAACGLAGLFSKTLSGPPAYVPLDIADRVAGLSAAHALLAALLMRERTGLGQFVEVPMFESLVSVVLGDHMGGATYCPDAGPMGYARLLTTHRRPYQTRDGYIATLIYTDKHWRSFFNAAGTPEVIDDNPEFQNYASRAKHYDRLYKILTDVFKTRGTEEWLRIMESNDIPCSRIPDLESLMEDEHLKAVGFFERRQHPTQGEIIDMNVASRWSTADLSIRRDAPLVGEHSEEILREFGFTAEQIDELAEQGATSLCPGAAA